MSQIFDALQRAEAEHSGNNAQTPLIATEILERAERLASSEWEKEDSRVEMRKTGPARNGTTALHAAVAGIPGLVSPGVGHALDDEQIERALHAMQDVDLNLPEESRLVCVTGQQDSPTAEAFRLLALRIRDMQQDRVLKKILVTSTLPQEGKSTVAANLACALAQAGKQRVVLLEGDVRKPSQSRQFGLESLKGMCEWLQGEQELANCIYRIKAAGLWILPAGAASRNHVDLLQPGKVAAMMARLEELFDTIVIDSPPVLPLADTSVWTRLADGILLVTREGTTQKRQLQKGIEAIDREKLIGALLNCSVQDGNAYYYY
jgi:capsular exopolysaccharide synthesis family protein